MIIKKSKQFEKDIRRVYKQGHDLEQVEMIINLLAGSDILDSHYRDHSLLDTKDYTNCRELHIKPDLLLIYSYTEEKTYLQLIRIGSHSELYR